MCQRATMVPPVGAVTGVVTTPAVNVNPLAIPTVAGARINSLTHNFDHLVGRLQHSGLIDMASPVDPTPLPSCIRKALSRPDVTLIVTPAVISDHDAEEDSAILNRLNWLQSPMNLDQVIINEDVERFIQKRFCAADMTILNLEKKGSRQRRKDIVAQKQAIYQDVRRVLEIRQQRYKLQKFKLGDAFAVTEIEDLKSREFRVAAGAQPAEPPPCRKGFVVVGVVCIGVVVGVAVGFFC